MDDERLAQNGLVGFWPEVVRSVLAHGLGGGKLVPDFVVLGEAEFFGHGYTWKLSVVVAGLVRTVVGQGPLCSETHLVLPSERFHNTAKP